MNYIDELMDTKYNLQKIVNVNNENILTINNVSNKNYKNLEFIINKILLLQQKRTNRSICLGLDLILIFIINFFPFYEKYNSIIFILDIILCFKFLYNNLKYSSYNKKINKLEKKYLILNTNKNKTIRRLQGIYKNNNIILNKIRKINALIEKENQKYEVFNYE